MDAAARAGGAVWRLDYDWFVFSVPKYYVVLLLRYLTCSRAEGGRAERVCELGIGVRKSTSAKFGAGLVGPNAFDFSRSRSNMNIYH